MEPAGRIRIEPAGCNLTGLASSAELADRVAAGLARNAAPSARVIVAFSGGLDSSVLLHLLAGLRGRLPFALSAVHIHHGLSPDADAWVTLCTSRAAALAVSLDVRHVAVTVRDRGVEAGARDARYRFLAGLDADLVALAHHRDDQAETFLLQALRGAGVAGLAAMPEFLPRPAGPALWRPLLDVPRESLRGYAREHGLRWVEDGSNRDEGLRRNFLRRRILPVLAGPFPAAAETLARAARHAAEAAELLDELARLDAGLAVCEGRLALSVLAGLSPARAKNLLRHFLSERLGQNPPAAWLAEALRQLLGAAPDAAVALLFLSHTLRRHGGYAHLIPEPEHPAPGAWPWRGEACFRWAGEGWRVRRVTGSGLDAGLLAAGPVTLRLRGGGERLRPVCGGPARTLKNLLREAGLAPWRRAHWPLIYCGDRLAGVPGVAVDCAFQARPGAPGLVFGPAAPGEEGGAHRADGD